MLRRENKVAESEEVRQGRAVLLWWSSETLVLYTDEMPIMGNNPLGLLLNVKNLKKDSLFIGPLNLDDFRWAKKCRGYNHYIGVIKNGNWVMIRIANFFKIFFFEKYNTNLKKPNHMIYLETTNLG